MFTKSLALRILAINIILIVLPLMVYFLFLFDWEYNENIITDIQRLRNVGFSRASYFEEFIKNQYLTLDTIEDLTDLKNPNRTNDIQKQFEQITATGPYTGVGMFAATPDNHYVLEYATPLKERGRDLTYRTYVQNSVERGRDSYLAYDDTTFLREFIISKAVYSRTNYKLLGILAAVMPAKSILQTLMENKYLDQETVSLLTIDKIVFVSSNPDFTETALVPLSAKRLAELEADKQFGNLKVPKKTLSLTPFPNLKNVFEWTENKVTRIGVLIPVIGNHFILVDLDKRAIIQKYTTATIQTIIVLLVITFVSCFITLFLSWLLSRALKELITVMDTVTQGNLSARFERRLFGFEINEAGKTLNIMLDHLLEQTEKAHNEQLKTEAISKELKIGREIQETILPHDIPKMPGIEIGIFSKPASEVGGDFYDIYPIKDQLFIALTDTSGKGILACLYSICLRSMLRSFATMNQDLSVILQKTNALFHEDLQGSPLLVKTFVALWDHKTLMLNYASAGPSFGFIRSPQAKTEPLAGSRSAMGAQADSSFTNYNIHLEPGSIVVLYTTGAVEQQSPDGSLYGEQGLKAIIEHHALLGAQEIANVIDHDLDQFAGNTPQAEDITVIILKITSGS